MTDATEPTTTFIKKNADSRLIENITFTINHDGFIRWVNKYKILHSINQQNVVSQYIEFPILVQPCEKCVLFYNNFLVLMSKNFNSII
ncbi:MAG: hypothetical protein DRI70_08235 [Bacteroidetes bacterium]|nr:MAG: hypothetical protein DRI70_08235 [Bacteroidota bacterium]